jgi:probable addiction module antidote protein
MARVTESTAVKRKTPSSSSLSAERKKRKNRISSRPKNTGRITNPVFPPSEPYEIGLYKRLADLPHAMGYLTECLDDDEPSIFLLAIKDVIAAHGGMTRIAKATGLNRESLYKALSLGGNPSMHTIRLIVHALGLRFTFEKALTEKERKARG